MNRDLFEDFTTLKWVKWTKRKPNHNGSIFMRFNGKNAGIGFVFNGKLRKLSGLSEDEFKNYEDTFYWQEEIIDVEKFSEYRNSCVESSFPADKCLCLKCSPNVFPNIIFNVCSICGNKRCPHASDHNYECTNSNDVGQTGSVYSGGN